MGQPEAYVQISAAILQMSSWSKISGKLDKKIRILVGVGHEYGFREKSFPKLAFDYENIWLCIFRHILHTWDEYMNIS